MIKVLSHTQDAFLVSVESPLGPTEQPTKRHRQARSKHAGSSHSVALQGATHRESWPKANCPILNKVACHSKTNGLRANATLSGFNKSRQQHECSACGAPCDTPLRPHCRHVLKYAPSSSRPEPRRLLRSLAEVARRSVRPALDASYTLPPGAAGAPPVDVRDVAGQVPRHRRAWGHQTQRGFYNVMY